jgi:hypothetical protein
MTIDPKNPSVLDARELDAQVRPTAWDRLLGKKPAERFIVFYRQDTDDWVMERASDGQAMESGTLDEMLAMIGTKYPNARRATWAEDMGRYRPFFLSAEAKIAQERVDDALDAVASSKS